MELIYKTSNKALIRKANKAIKLGQYFPCSYVSDWGIGSIDETSPFTLAKLQARNSAALAANFVAGANVTPALVTAWSDDAPYYDPAYQWAYTEATSCCWKYSVPSAILSRQYTAITLDFYDAGGTLAEYVGTSDDPVFSFSSPWNNATYPVLFGVCITTTRPATPNAAGTPLFTIDMNQATNASVAGNAGITGDGTGYWPVFIDSTEAITSKITSSFLDSIEGYSDLYITVKPYSIPEFWIPSDYSRVLHKQVLSMPAPYVWIYA